MVPAIPPKRAPLAGYLVGTLLALVVGGCSREEPEEAGTPIGALVPFTGPPSEASSRSGETGQVSLCSLTGATR